VRERPALTGVAQKDWDAGVNQLDRMGLITVGKKTEKPTGKAIYLSPAGLKLQSDYPALLGEIEEPWEKQCSDVRKQLERVVDDALSWTTPHPGNWREHRPLTTLPHQPIVTHRGGYPDGS
jgi:hypothetical protein